jgi:hypothetical protein
MDVELSEKNDVFYAWLAGFLDADGTFSIVLGKQRTLKDYLAVKPQIRVAQRHYEMAEKTLYMIQQETRIGKIYISNKSTEKAIISWQTTTLNEAIIIAKKVLPFLIEKKHRAEYFIEALELWSSTYNYEKARSRPNGGRIRTIEDILKIIKIATSINEGRQTKRYRDYKGYDYWEPLIREWYK